LKCFDLKEMRPKWNEMQSFFCGYFFTIFFGRVSGNFGKILRTPKNMPDPTPMEGMGFQDFH